MKIRILYGYRSKATQEQYLAPGIHEVEDSLAQYLIENSHASIIEPPKRKSPGRPRATRKQAE